MDRARSAAPGHPDNAPAPSARMRMSSCAGCWAAWAPTRPTSAGYRTTTGPILVVFDGDRPGLPALDLALFRRRLDAGARVVDVRPVIDFATARVPGSISNELRPQFASYLDWTVDPVVPLLFVTNPDTDLDDLVSQCLNIGYERLAGHLSGGVLRWRDAGRPHRPRQRRRTGSGHGSRRPPGRRVCRWARAGRAAPGARGTRRRGGVG